MKDKNEDQNRDRGKQPDARREQNDQHEAAQTPGSPRLEHPFDGEAERRRRPGSLGGSPGQMKVPTSEPGGSGVVRGDSGIQSGSGLDTSGAAGVPGAGLSEEATTRSEERDGGSAPGSTDFSHVSEMGDTGMAGPVGGTAGITGYMGKTGVVGRPPDMAGSAGVADRGETDPRKPSVPRYHTGKRSGGNVGGPTGGETGPGGLKGTPPQDWEKPSGGTPGVHGHTPSGGVAGGSEPPQGEEKRRRNEPDVRE